MPYLSKLAPISKLQLLDQVENLKPQGLEVEVNFSFKIMLGDHSGGDSHGKEGG